MNYISTTDLRTKSSELVSLLIAGEGVDLIYRSKVIGEIKPKKASTKKIISSEKLYKTINELDLPKLTLKEIDRRYKSAMMKKHGQGIS